MDTIYSTISVCLLIFATIFCATQKPEDECSAKMVNSTCESVKSCPYILKLIDTKDFEKLSKLTCGFEGNRPKACCPKGEVPVLYNFTEEIATNRPKTTSKPLHKIITTIAPHIMEETDTTFPSKAVCGKNSDGVGDRIVGGTITRIDEHPWLARLQYKIDNANTFGCSATLITDRYLLTAAHCVVRRKPTSVRLGEWNVKTSIDCYKNLCNNKTIDVKVTKIIAHPSFNLSIPTDSDIALIQLEEAVTFSEYIQPICLPITSYITMQDYSHDIDYFAAGWGLTEFEEESDVKRQVQIKAAPIEVCRNLFKLKPESVPKLICAGGTKGKDTCKGDSGGPLVRYLSEDYDYNWYLFGIISLGSRNCGAEGVPSLYTRVSVYMNWIRAIVSS